MSRLFILLLFVLAPVVHADTDATTSSPVRLKVKPVLCITDERTPFCQMSFLVEWQSDVMGDYCLHNDIEKSALRCWVDRQAGELDDERAVQNAFTYWMSDDDDSLLATVTVEVLRMETEDRRRKRRGRHVWDIL